MNAGSEWQLPQSLGISARLIFPLKPAFLPMEISGSSLVASPPWQLAQVSPFCAWISWLNFCSVTPRLSVKIEWHSRHEFFVWACAAAASSKPAATTRRHREANKAGDLLCKVAINGHSYDVCESHNCQRIDPPSGASAVNKRQHQPDRSRHSESQHTQNYAIHEKYFGRNYLECLEHEQEIPLRLDSGRRGNKWVRF